MSTMKIVRLAAASAVLAIVGAVAVACSDDTSEPAPNNNPTTHDSGVQNQVDSSPPNSGDDAGDAGSQEDTGPPIDAALPDVGACTSDAATCNSCYTPQQDPVNGCSPAAANCVKFDNTRVPANAP